MNKRVLTSIVILLLVLMFTLVAYNVLQRRLTALGEAVRGAVYAQAPCAAIAQNVRAQADLAEPILMLLVDRRDVSQLLAQIRQTDLMQSDPNAYREECVRALSLLREMARRQTFSISNLF